MTNLFLVRHGESEGNINPKKYYEKLDCDISLTDKGLAQSRKAGNQIIDLQKKYGHYINHSYEVYYSPYLRAKQTKNVLIEGLNEDKYYDCVARQYCSPLLREREWGNLRDIVDAGAKNEDHFNFFYRASNGESFSDCYNRVVLFDQFLKNHHACTNVIVVSHGEWIKLYLMYKFGWDLDDFARYKNPKNCEVLWLKDNKLSIETPLTTRHKVK